MNTKSLRIVTATALSLALAIPATALAGGGKDGKARGAHFQKADKNGDGYLTEAEVGAQRWQRMKRADTNKDNKVSKEELKAAFRGKKGAHFQKADKNGDGYLTEAEVGAQRWQRMKRADTNKDNKVSKEELKAAFRGKKGAHFQKADKNGDGYLTEAEVGAQRWQRMKRADTNKDNKVSKEELKAAFRGKKGARSHKAGGAHRPSARGKTASAPSRGNMRAAQVGGSHSRA